ncbi:hypothetical protein BDV27DRAFT_85807 [Aspergillus caelatus]|uniref:Uncharacterized protein n=1 Tax=Aspergillus caelatus TaxID=61420 RepID=A0A5N7AAI1_9EURO|nr:uncharacterized protein BDV27DRAFT_85807 [Aspergillus caelatus]KAE8366832.1 hypothetical protein BDV27DRAFT_85807 [Aspergillus caelatus]
MAPELDSSVNPPPAPEASNTSGAGTDTKATGAASKQTNDDIIRAKPVDADDQSEEKESPEATESSKEHKPAEEAKSGGHASILPDDGPKEPTTENGIAQPSPGDKREHEPTSTPTNAAKSNVENLTEPANKKQRTTGTRSRNGNTIAPATNGERSKASRSKKAKDDVKKVIPTDGIGSRTRSRTKASS